MFETCLKGLDGLSIPVLTVAAKVEFETWFVASAETMGDLLELPDDFEPIVDPETTRRKKKWIQDRFGRPGGRSYQETVDMRSFVSRIDIPLCRRRSPSFDYLCTKLEALCTEASTVGHREVG